jgi:hypothetical protein
LEAAVEILKAVYRKLVKNKKIDRFLRNTYYRLKIILEVIKPHVLIPHVPFGHYYSPCPSMNDIKRKNFSCGIREISGIDLNTDEQMELLNSFDLFYKEIPFNEQKTASMRYYFKNGFYSYSDAVFLYCMIRHLKPKRLIEAGSGFSSSVSLDTNELFMGNKILCTFIEPFPQRLKSLLKGGEKDSVKIYETGLQEISLNIFRELEKDDILFIDSTHVSKCGSDVNYIIHEILPVLSEGVYIHFHDVFYPFEYPKEWFLGGYAWNEQYILRAFLEYNERYKIVLFNTYLQKKYEDELRKRFPLIYKNTGGSIWIKKI